MRSRLRSGLLFLGSKHEPTGPVLEPGLVFCGKPFKGRADLIVRHHAGKTAAALNLPLKLILIHI